MNLVFKNDKIAVYDDVLTDMEFLCLREAMKAQPFGLYTFSGYMSYSMSADDKPGYKSSNISNSFPDPQPIAAEIDPFYYRLDEIVKESNITLPSVSCSSSFWIYPPGSGLHYHNDGIYAGSYAFYIHEEWDETWGGELLIRPDNDDLGGQFIIPKPNRLVLIAPNILHSINPVHLRAGNRHRQSLAGFLHVNPKD